MVLFTLLSEHFPILYPVARTLDIFLVFVVINIILYKNAKRLRLQAAAEWQARFFARFARFRILVPVVFGLLTLLLYINDRECERIRLEIDPLSAPGPNSWLPNFQLTWYFTYVLLRRAGYRVLCVAIAAVSLGIEVMVIRRTCFPERFASGPEGAALPDSRDCFEQAYQVPFVLLGMGLIEFAEWRKRRQPVVDDEKSDSELEKQPVERVEDSEIDESEKEKEDMS